MEDQDVPVEPEEEMTLPAGTRLGKYKVVRLLGAGGMGAVYEAVHTEIGRRVAVKTLAPGVAAIPGARQRFLREAQLTSRLRHPHIVDLTDMGSEGHIAYLVMELLAGEDLAHRLERTGPMAPRDLVDLMLPVCSALIEAHAAGIVHRDLKPQNIFLATGHRGVEPKVLDFGISKSSDSDVSALTGTGSVIGTPHYLAPEQIKDARSASASSDQYSLGVIFYKCLTNQNPFEGKNLFGVLHAIVTEKPVPLRARRPDLPEGLERVVARAMNPLPRERFASVRELGRALLPYASAKACAIWEEIFTAGESAAAPEPRPTERSYTMPMPLPTPERPVRLASAAPTAKLERLDSGTLSPAVTSNTSLGLGALTAPRRGRVVLLSLVGAALAAGGYVVFSRGASAPEAPPSAAAQPPVAPVAAPPPVAPVAEPPAAAAAEQARLQAKRQAALDEANTREAQARAEAAAKAAAAKRDAEAKTAAAKEAEVTAAAKEAEASARRRSSARHGSHARREAPASNPRNLNPNGAPVID